jgi:hypothetical protein
LDEEPEDLNNPSTLLVYRRADGQLIEGQHEFVTNLDLFEGYKQPVELIKELWMLGGRRKMTYTPKGYQPESD